MRTVSFFMGLILLTWPCLQGQDSGLPYIRSYRARDYKASSANYAVAQDQRGLMYFGNHRGVLEFDGTNWRLITLPNRYAGGSVVSDSLGRIYVGTLGEFGFLQPDSSGLLGYRSLLPELPREFAPLTSPVIALGAGKGAYFQVLADSLLLHWDGSRLRSYHSAELAETGRCFFFKNRLYGVHPKHGLVSWEGGTFSPVPGGSRLRDSRLQALIPFAGEVVMARLQGRGFFFLRFEEGKVEVRPFPTDIDSKLGRDGFTGVTPLPDSRFAVFSQRGGVYLIDENGQLQQQLNTRSGLQDNLVNSGLLGQRQNLWLALSKGIARIDVASPLSHWGEASGLKGLVFSVLRHRGRLYASTPLGVFYLKDDRFEPVQGLEAESWKLFHLIDADNPRDSLLLAATSRGLYEIRGNQSYPQAARQPLIYPRVSRAYPGRLYFQFHSAGPAYLTRKNGRWSEMVRLSRLHGNYRSLGEDPQGRLWLVDMVRNQELVRIDPEAASEDPAGLLHLSLPPSVGPANECAYLGGELVFATEQGLFTFSETDSSFTPYRGLGEALVGGSISRLVEGPNHHIWLERYRGQQHWVEWLQQQPDGSYQLDSVMLRGLSELEIWGDLYPESDGRCWVGTPEGLFCYDTRRRQLSPQPFYPLIRAVTTAKDSPLFSGAYPLPDSLPVLRPRFQPQPDWLKPRLPFSLNSVSFEYAAPFFEDEGRTRYSYWLRGEEEGWSPWSTEHKKDYTRLSPGNYEFQVKARNIFNQESKVVSFAFAIEPPWYRSLWAFVGYGILGLLLIYGTVRLNTQRLKVQNETLERMVFERTQEIWEQHKEIVKKTVALKRQKEELAEQHRLVEEKNQALEQTLAQLKNAQSKLVESEKMASLGQLTAGIAHEINNPINFIKGNVGPLKRDFGEIRELFQRFQALRTQDAATLPASMKALWAYCEEIEAAYLFQEMEQLLSGIDTGANRTKEIVAGLRIFARTERDDFKQAGLDAGLEATLTLLQHKLKDRVIVHRDYANLPLIECQPGKLNQVFMNVDRKSVV
jgi:signal transduction histidine kinase